MRNPIPGRRAASIVPRLALLAVAWAVLIFAMQAGAGGAPPAATSATPEAPIGIAGTTANLQLAFTNEMNAKERYLAAAKQADREGYPSAARIFRACAKAEQVHADRHAWAIAVAGGEARALLEHIALDTTPENLRSAIEREAAEAGEFYPALIARARAEHRPSALRSFNFALAAEREHARLLAEALQNLDKPAPAGKVYVCPLCGKTTTSLDFRKCPNCFTSARKFAVVI